MRRALVLFTGLALSAAGTLLPAVAAQASQSSRTASVTRAAPAHLLRAGAGVVDATWHVGASAGQYAADEASTPADPTDPAAVVDAGQQNITDEWDPNLQHTTKQSSYGVQSRLSVRALVLQSGDDAPVALVKQDLYLAQDLVTRRAAQILAADGSAVTYDHLLLSSTHDHSSPYYSTPAAGVWVFQDAFDLRFFEYQARAIAHAVEQGERAMRPARLGATTVQQGFVQTNIVGPAKADDGTPAGYPRDENDHGLVVMRVDGTDGRPIATWMNFGQHPEGLDGYALVSADYLAPLQRYVDRATGAPLVFSQGGVGSSEGPYEGYYPRGQEPRTADGVIKAFAHVGHAQVERGARILADSVLAGWRDIGTGAAGVALPMSDDVPVAMVTHWIPGPVSHPYPSYGNCRSGPTVDGDPGAGGLPDCQRLGTGVSSPLYENLQGAGVPIPDSYAASSFSLVEENARIKLQAVRLGDMVLASCSCEPQVDLVKNLESRLDDVGGNGYAGYDYPCRRADDGTWTCTQADPRAAGGATTYHLSAVQHAKLVAEVDNNAAGWDDAAYATQAGSEPADPGAVKGNFTHTELPPALGYRLAVALGHTGDYNGYIVSYREYQNRESYRKALTSYGPHSADYMTTHLLDLARFLRDGTAIPPVVNQSVGDADEQREAAEATTLGQLGSYYLDGWDATRPDDAGPAAALAQPVGVLPRFGAASFTWRGGGNWTDNPDAHVQRLVDGRWTPYADMSGEVVTSLTLPPGVSTLATDRTGTQEWRWTATFEAFDAGPRADVDGAQVPAGTYRFVVNGAIHSGGHPTPYQVESRPFQVTPWEGLHAGDPRLLPGGDVALTTDPVVYPRTYTPPASLRLIRDDGGDDGTAAHRLLCRTCSVRPWVRTGLVATVDVTVARAGQVVRVVSASRQPDGTWTALTALAPGELAYVARAGVHDTYGELNGVATRAVGPDGVLVDAPVTDPAAVVPEVPVALLLPLAAAGAAGMLLPRRRRRA